jgi:PKD repeat protein
MRTLFALLALASLLAATGQAQLVADFSASPTSGAADLWVTFSDQSSGASPDLWQWDFGDGQSTLSLLPGVTYQYKQAGTYTVTMTATAFPSDSDSVTKVDLVVVTTPALTPAISATPTTGVLPLDVQFNDATTGDGTPSSWSWDFGDGNTSGQQDPSHTYEAPGSYTVTLDVVADGQSWQVVETDLITVDPAPLVADFNASSTSGELPLEVDFTDASTGADVETWAWDFGDGTSSNAQHPTHVYDVPGSYTASSRRPSPRPT